MSNETKGGIQRLEGLLLDGEENTILVRRDTSTNFASDNPVLSNGEPGYETDTGVFKVGDGFTAWNSLPAISGGGGGGGGDTNIDGGAAASVYQAAEIIDGGSANG